MHYVKYSLIENNDNNTITYIKFVTQIKVINY